MACVEINGLDVTACKWLSNMKRKINFLFVALAWVCKAFDWKKCQVRFLTCSLCGKTVFLKFNDDLGAMRCLFCFATPVHMAMGAALKSRIKNLNNKSVYELSAHGAFYNFLKRNVGDFTSSEYFEEVPRGEYSRGILCQDVQRLTFADNSFNLCTSTALFEHVADDLQGFREILRVLQPGGFFIFSIPIHDTKTTAERARLEEGHLVYLLEPVYHDDIFLKGPDAALVYRDYGRDVILRLTNAGFEKAEMFSLSSFLDISLTAKGSSGETPYIVIAVKGDPRDANR